jgi:hypothetical protein
MIGTWERAWQRFIVLRSQGKSRRGAANVVAHTRALSRLIVKPDQKLP